MSHDPKHDPLANKSQAWSALFSEPMSELVQRYTASVPFDRRLAQADIAGSLAHARMLAAQGVISAQDLADIERGMAQIKADIDAGSFEWKLELEDVHLNIEARLTALVGDAGKRLHTGRSRNDQVATDVRLWLRGEIDALAPLLAQMQLALLDMAAPHTHTILPGTTHLQVAQPVSFAHHLLAYVEMFSRDAERLADVRRRVNRLPLGAAALAGTSYPLDRDRVAAELGFDGLCMNSLDAVSDRDFAIEFCAWAAITMMHVSRLAEEIVLWMSQNYGYIDLADRYCTGSSIMPQKRNPDVAELARGKTGRVVRPPHRDADPDEGPAAHVQQGQPGRQGAAVRRRRHAGGHAAHHGRDGARHRRQARRDGARRAPRLCHGHRPGRLPGEEGRALPRRARGGGRRGEGRPAAGRGPVRTAAGHAARLPRRPSTLTCTSAR